MTSQFFAGVDEVGRGCLAGPVISVAIILNDYIDKTILRDSKKISPLKRIKIAKYILQNCNSIGVGVCDNHIVDKINIHKATLESMRRALANLAISPQMAYIDGMYKPEVDIHCKCIINGDDLIPEISAASIVAKVLRDNEMRIIDKKLPIYGFLKHKGYGTKEHMLAITTFGPSIFHRLSFSPMKEN